MHPTSKDERPRSIGNNMSMVIKVFESAVVSVSYLVHYDILLQNATDITKRNNYFIAKCDKTLTLCQVIYYKMRQLHDKLQQLLQNASFITKCINAVAKGEVGSAKMPLIYYYRKENESLQSIGLPLLYKF